LQADGAAVELDVAAAVLGEVRKAKALAKRSLRTEVRRALVRDSSDRLAVLERVRDDVVEAGNVATLETEPADAFDVAVDLVD
jgi:valyl-tRNA synthetase